MPEKEGGLPKLDRSRDVTGRVNIIQSLFLPASSAKRTNSGFSKKF